MEARNSNGTRRTPTHKARSITTQDVLWRVKPRGSLAAALKSYLLYRPCARARARSFSRAPFCFPLIPWPIIAASYYVGSFSAPAREVALMPDKGHSRCRTYRRSAAKRDTAAIFQITPGPLGYAARALSSRSRATRVQGAARSHGPDTGLSPSRRSRMMISWMLVVLTSKTRSRTRE